MWRRHFCVGKKQLPLSSVRLDKGGFMSAMGKAPNNHVALLYKGPGSFRDHSFAFKFFPKNKPESDLVKDIISEFKNGTLPKLAMYRNQCIELIFFQSS